MLYVDHAATSPVRPEVLEAMRPYLTDVFGNPSSHHTAGEAAARALDESRTRVAEILGVRAGDVVFTAGGTEANNLAIKGIVLGGRRRHIVTTPIEHESILESVDYLRRFHDADARLVPVGGTGRLDPRAVADALRDDTAVLAFAHANNEIGTVQDAAALAAVAHERGVPVHVDAVQSAGWLDLRPLGREARVDSIAVAGHKVGAPKGIGALAVRSRIPLEPLVHGGGQERGRRSGTENVAGAVALAVALELAEEDRRRDGAAVARATTRFIDAVLAAVPVARLSGDPVHRLPGTAGFTFAGVSGESVLLELERRGAIASSGSACAAGSDEPSHVLVACGIPPEVAQTSVRFTFSRTPLPAGAPEALAAAVASAVDAARGA